MNKFSDHLKATPFMTMDLNTVVDYSTPPEVGDLRESDVILFVIKTEGAWGIGTLDIVVEGVKLTDPPGVGTPAFSILNIPVIDPEPNLVAVDVKAEDIIGLLGDEYPLVQIRMSQTGGEGPTYVTPVVIANEDHKSFNAMGYYDDVFSRMYTTPGAGGGGGPI